jgi:hypothetical protein
LTSWPFSFAGKISRAASCNKEIVTAAPLALAAPPPGRYWSAAGFGNTEVAENRPVERMVEFEELLHALTLDTAKI